MPKPKIGSVYRRKKRNRNGRMVELPTWWIKYSKDGRIFRESSKSKSRVDAERLLKQRLGEIATGAFVGLDPERVRMRELFRDLLEDYELHQRASLKDVEARIRLHLNPNLGKVRASELSTSDVRRFINLRRQEGAAEASINRELSIIRRSWNLGLQAEPPKVRRAIHIPRLREDNARQGFLEPDQYVTLRHELPDYLRPLLVVAYYTGVRIGELRQLTWMQVDLTSKEIRLIGSQTKNGHPRTLPIYGDMLPWLTWLKADRDRRWPTCPWVFQLDGFPVGDFRKAWKGACERAGVPGLLFHDLRRSAVRNMERAGVPRNVAMAISGHRTDIVYRRYDIVNARDLARAALRMSEYLGTLLGTPADSATSVNESSDRKLLN